MRGEEEFVVPSQPYWSRLLNKTLYQLPNLQDFLHLFNMNASVSRTPLSLLHFCITFLLFQGGTTSSDPANLAISTALKQVFIAII